MKICKYCLIQFQEKKHLQQFCGRSCSAKYRRIILNISGRRKKGKYKKCLNCEVKIYVHEKDIKKNFCSCSCRAKYYSVGSLRKNGKQIECPICKKSTYTCPSTLKLNKTGIKFCSRKCRAVAMKTGFTKWSFQKSSKDYGNNPRKRIQINKVRFYEHRKLMEDKLGRKLDRWEHVHHINENPKDNRIENLQVLSNIEHARIHKKKK